jgi:hypothetical protein
MEKDSSKDICLPSYFSRTSVATSRMKVVCLHKCVAQAVCVLLNASLLVFFLCLHFKLSHKIPFLDTWPLRGRPHEHEDFRRQKLDWQMIAKGTGSAFTSGPMESLPKIILYFGVLTAVKIIFFVFIVVTKPCGFVGRYQPFGNPTANFFTDEATGSNTCLRNTDS